MQCKFHCMTQGNHYFIAQRAADTEFISENNLLVQQMFWYGLVYAPA
jgi:hypothetical protein